MRDAPETALSIMFCIKPMIKRGIEEGHLRPDSENVKMACVQIIHICQSLTMPVDIESIPGIYLISQLETVQCNTLRFNAHACSPPVCKND